jgi:hypothetical protein
MGPQTDKHLSLSPFTSKWFKTTRFCFGVYFYHLSRGTRNRAGIGLSESEFVNVKGVQELFPWNRFLGSVKVYIFLLWSLLLALLP